MDVLQLCPDAVGWGRGHMCKVAPRALEPGCQAASPEDPNPAGTTLDPGGPDQRAGCPRLVLSSAFEDRHPRERMSTGVLTFRQPTLLEHLGAMVAGRAHAEA